MSHSKLLEASQQIAGRIVGADVNAPGAIDPSVFELIDRIAEIALQVLDRCLEARRNPDEAIQALRRPTRLQQWRLRNVVRSRLPGAYRADFVRVADELMLYAERAADADLKQIVAESASPDHVLI